MKESALQTWFEERLADETLREHITNVNSFHQWFSELSERKRNAELRTYAWVRRAQYPLAALCHSDKILANQSMHAQGESQKRPDFLLQDDNGAYTLVELKTNRQAERQGIQELLAYTAELHQQVPFLVAVYLVMVARHWDDSLTNASKGALLAGVCLLPLRVLGDLDNGIKLEINLDVLRAPTPAPIHAPSALTPYVLARATTSPSDEHQTVRKLTDLSKRVQRECQKVAQTGFVCVWRAKVDQDVLHPTIGITLFSVDQNWMFGDCAWETQELAELAFNAQPAFMHRVLKKTSTPPWTTNPSFSIMERLSEQEQADLGLEWGTDGRNFEGYIQTVSKVFSYWSTLSLHPFGTMQDFWREHSFLTFGSFNAYQLEQLVIQFNEYHAEIIRMQNSCIKT